MPKRLKLYITFFFTIILFYFFMCDELSFINTMQKTLKPSKKKFQFPRWMRKNFIPWKFSWWVLAVETWTYINLVIPKILFILVLWDHPMENFLTIVTSWRRGEAGEGGGVRVLRMPFYVKSFWNCDTGLQKNIFCFLSNFEFRFSSPSTPVDQYFCS